MGRKWDIFLNMRRMWEEYGKNLTEMGRIIRILPI